MDNFNLRKYLAEGKLYEDEGIKSIFDEYSDRFSDGVHHDNPSDDFTYEKDEHLDPEMYDQEDVDKFQAMISHLQSQPDQSVSYSDHHSDRTFTLTGNGDIHFTISWKGEGYEEESLAEGKLLNENIEQYITHEDDISAIRGRESYKTIAINFNRRMNGGQRKEAVEAYVYDKYGNDVELDWRDGQEVEIHINRPKDEWGR